MDDQIKTIEQARTWFSKKGNNKDGKGIICHNGSAQMRCGTVKEAEKFYGVEPAKKGKK